MPTLCHSARWILTLILGLLTASCEMPRDRYVDILTTADSGMTAKQRGLEQQFHIGSYQHFDYDEANGAFVFSDSGFARVLADAQFVGEVSRRDSVWTWAWALPYVNSGFTRTSRQARRYGWIHGIQRLRTSGWHADQVDGWEMTSLTAWIGNAAGAYRAPSSDSSIYVFLLLNNVRWAPPGRSVDAYIKSPRNDR
jgi:hypothetical protein